MVNVAGINKPLTTNPGVHRHLDNSNNIVLKGPSKPDPHCPPVCQSLGISDRRVKSCTRYWTFKGCEDHLKDEQETKAKIKIR